MKKNITKTNAQIKLIEFLFKTHKLGTDFFIAKTMLEKSDSFPDVTIKEIAYDSNTTPASVTKLCQKIGYNGFVELIQDNTWARSNYFFQIFFEDNIAKPTDDVLDNFISLNNSLQKNIFKVLDEEQIVRIAKRVVNAKKITIISGLHGFAATNLFAELMFPFDIIVYEIERGSDATILENALDFSDIIFVISLTGQWINTIFPDLNLNEKELQKIIVLNHSDTITIPFSEIVSFSSIENFYNSNYISSTVLQSFFITLTAHVNKMVHEKY